MVKYAESKPQVVKGRIIRQGISLFDFDALGQHGLSQHNEIVADQTVMRIPPSRLKRPTLQDAKVKQNVTLDQARWALMTLIFVYQPVIHALQYLNTTKKPNQQLLSWLHGLETQLGAHALLQAPINALRWTPHPRP